MRPEKLSEAIGMLPDEIIEETDAVRRNVRGSMKRKRRHRIYRYLSAAACLAILICVSFIWDGKKEGKTEHLDLPQISVGNNEAASYGFEGYLAHDVSELVNANPWNEQIELTTHFRCTKIQLSWKNLFLRTMIKKKYWKRSGRLPEDWGLMNLHSVR